MSLGLPCVLAFNYYIDPLQFYRKATLLRPVLYEQQRYQNPGFARNFDYNAVVLGTSMTENFEPEYINKALGVKTIKLSISGSLITEQKMILEVAIKTNKVKNVIWGIDYSSLSCEPNKVRDEDAEFPYYLYDNNLLNDYKYLLNSNTTEMSFKTLYRTYITKTKHNQNIDNYANWSYNFFYGKSYALGAYNKLITNPRLKADIQNYSWSNIKTNLNNNITKTVQQNPNITFYIFFTPTSILAHQYFYKKNPDVFINELKARKLLVESCSELSNCKLYDFQTIENIITHLEYYKDQSHYSQEINYKMIDFIKMDRYRLTKENIHSNNYKLTNLLLNSKF